MAAASWKSLKIATHTSSLRACLSVCVWACACVCLSVCLSVCVCGVRARARGRMCERACAVHACVRTRVFLCVRTRHLPASTNVYLEEIGRQSNEDLLASHHDTKARLECPQVGLRSVAVLTLPQALQTCNTRPSPLAPRSKRCELVCAEKEISKPMCCCCYLENKFVFRLKCAGANLFAFSSSSVTLTSDRPEANWAPSTLQKGSFAVVWKSCLKLGSRSHRRAAGGDGHVHLQLCVHVTFPNDFHSNRRVFTWVTTFRLTPSESFWAFSLVFVDLPVKRRLS